MYGVENWEAFPGPVGNEVILAEKVLHWFESSYRSQSNLKILRRNTFIFVSVLQIWRAVYFDCGWVENRNFIIVLENSKLTNDERTHARAQIGHAWSVFAALHYPTWACICRLANRLFPPTKHLVGSEVACGCVKFAFDQRQACLTFATDIVGSSF